MDAATDSLDSPGELHLPKDPSWKLQAKTEQVDYDFRFVEVGQSFKSRDPESRSIVRAHVMRDFYGKKKDARRRVSQPDTTSQHASSHRFKVGPSGLQEIGNKGKGGSAGLKSRAGPVKPPKHITDAVVQSAGDGTQRGHDRKVDAAHLGNSTYQSEEDLIAATAERSVGCSIREEEAGARQISVISPYIDSRGLLDPFDTLPLPNHSRTKILLYHAQKGIFSSPWMGQLRKEWLGLATQDIGLFHIALSHYAGNYGLERRENDPVEALRFRMRSMKIVNERLARKEDALSDGTIGTVASIASYEATNGNLFAAQTHMDGLKKMIHSRGRLHHCGMNEFTKRLVLWADLNSANALGRNPIFVAHECDETALSSSSSATTFQDETITSFPATTHQKGSLDQILPLLSKDLTESFTALRRITRWYPENLRSREVEKNVQIHRSDEVYLIERRLLALSNHISSPLIITSSCTAAIIFIDKHMRGIDFLAGIMGKFVTKLRLSMGLLFTEIVIAAAPLPIQRAVLWILCVGSVASANRPERLFFVTELERICDILGMSYWADVEDVLKNFLWPSAWDAESLQLWKEVGEILLRKE